ncbi:MAG: LTA synthase family protein [Bdellovibrionales bacterium]|nr:LTA synthase family protein [Bdellovibrionales bacterium]
MFLRTLRRLGWLLAVFSGERFIFWLYDHRVFQEYSAAEQLWAFVHGLRFDLSLLLLVNGPLILLSLLPAAFVIRAEYQRGLKWLYLGVNSPLLLLNLVDAEYFAIAGRRLALGTMSLGTDVGDHLGELARFYWWMVLLTGLIVWGLAKLWQRDLQIHPATTPPQRFAGTALLALALFAIVLGDRGGVQAKVLHPSHAFAAHPGPLAVLALNSPFNLIHLRGSVHTEDHHYFSNPSDVEKHLERSHYQIGSYTHAHPKDNVVIVILESFGAEYMGLGNPYRGYTPFLDSLGREGVFFSDAYANGRASIEALPSILAGLPSVHAQNFIGSLYQSVPLKGLGQLVRPSGHHTAFFHGASNGSMFFDAFTNLAGIEHYFGRNEYNNEKDFDGAWGIGDHNFLPWIARQLDAFPQPFAVSFFTLSSHHPYTVPPAFKGRFPKGDLELHESLGYADESLRMFFAQAAKSPWYKDTLFILTADHTQKNSVPAYNNNLGHFRVPIIFFHPSRNAELKHDLHADRVTQQADILPSVVDYLGIRDRGLLLPYGHSVFDNTNTGMAFFRLFSDFYLVEKDYYLTLPLGSKSSLYAKSDLKRIHDLSTQEPQIALRMDERIKALLQHFNDGLNSGHLYER